MSSHQYMKISATLHPSLLSDNLNNVLKAC